MERTALNRFLDAIYPAFLHGDPECDRKRIEKENVEHLRSMYQAITHGDIRTFENMLTDDTEMIIHGPAAIPFVGTWKGRNEVVAAMGRNLAHTSLQIPELLSIVAQGNVVVLYARDRGIVKATGAAYTALSVQIFTFDQGKLARFEQIFDTASLLEAFRMDG
jgi:ketosteroid isomerase-like protein